MLNWKQTCFGWHTLPFLLLLCPLMIIICHFTFGHCKFYFTWCSFLKIHNTLWFVSLSNTNKIQFDLMKTINRGQPSWLPIKKLKWLVFRFQTFFQKYENISMTAISHCLWVLLVKFLVTLEKRFPHFHLQRVPRGRRLVGDFYTCYLSTATCCWGVNDGRVDLCEGRKMETSCLPPLAVFWVSWLVWEITVGALPLQLLSSFTPQNRGETSLFLIPLSLSFPSSSPLMVFFFPLALLIWILMSFSPF